MPLCAKLSCLLLATYIFCTGDVRVAAKGRRIPISSYNRKDEFSLHVQFFDEATFNRTKELCDKIVRVLEPYKENRVVKIPGIQFQDPIRLQDMEFFSQYDTYESITLAEINAYGMSNFTVNLNNIEVPTYDMDQVHMQIYVTMGRLEVLGNFTLSPAHAALNVSNTGPFNFTVFDILAGGTLKISQVESGYQHTMTLLQIQHDEMRLRLDNFTLETEILKYEMFEAVEPQLREQVNTFSGRFADTVLEKVKALDSQIQKGPLTASKLAKWGNVLASDTNTNPDTESEPHLPTPVVQSTGVEGLASAVPKSSYSPNLGNTTLTDDPQETKVGEVQVQKSPTASQLAKWGKVLASDIDTGAEAKSEPPPSTPVVQSTGVEDLVSSEPKSSYSPTSENATTIKLQYNESSYNNTEELCKKIKKALDPYTTDGVVTIPGPKFFQDPMTLPNMSFLSGYDDFNFSDVRVHGMSNFTLNINWVGFIKEGMPVRIHMFLRTSRLEVLGKLTLDPGNFTSEQQKSEQPKSEQQKLEQQKSEQQKSEQPKSGPFNLTVIDVVPYGVLLISKDEFGYRRSMIPMLSIGHDDIQLDLGDVTLETDYFLKYDLYQAVESSFSAQARLFFFHFADKLLDQLEAFDNIDKESGNVLSEVYN